MRRLWPWIFTGLFLGGIAHIVSILLMPMFSGQDSLTRLMPLASINQLRFIPQATPGKAVLPFIDPGSAYAICAFDLSRSPLRIKADAGSTYLSIVFLQQGGAAFYALSERASQTGALDIRLATNVQMERIESLDPEDQPVRELRVRAPKPTGLVLVRSIANDEPHMTQAESRVKAVKCTPEP